MNLIIDIGNTVAKIAVFNGKELLEVFYDSNRSFGCLSGIYKKYSLRRGIIASVIGISDSIKRQLEEIKIDWIFFDEKTPIPVINKYKTPETLGGDRLAAVVGANDLFPRREILVIDSGTAITYEFIDAEGNYLGGNISPGIQMRFKALNLFTEKLPLISREGEIPAFGSDTESAIRSGVVRGVELEIKGYITLLKEKYPELLVFLTGGGEISFDTSLKNIIFADKFLVLKGLNRILIYNDKI